MEQVVTPDNATAAWRAVKRHGGAPGIAGRTTQERRDPGRQHWETLRAKLLAGTYVPSPGRRVEIPQPNGGLRLLGLPTGLDRWIQPMLLQALPPRFDPTFGARSFGFRPGESAPAAVRAAQSYAQAGKDWVVDRDITQFFDRVHHDILMARIGSTLRDKRGLGLLGRYLRAGGMAGGGAGQRGRHAARRAALPAPGQPLPGGAGPGVGTARPGVQPVGRRLQHLREQPTVGGTGAGEPDGLDRQPPAVGSQRDPERDGAALGTQVPGFSDQPGRADRSRAAECGTVQNESSGARAKRPESDPRSAAGPLARRCPRLVELLPPGRGTPEHLRTGGLDPTPPPGLFLATLGQRARTAAEAARPGTERTLAESGAPFPRGVADRRQSERCRRR